MNENVKSFDEWDRINEKSGDKYDYGCVMIYFDFPEINNLHEKIGKDDLYEEEQDRTYGLEDEPHVTLLYGLHDADINPDKVFEFIEPTPIGSIKLRNISMFDNENTPYQVLKFDAENENLHKLNKLLTENFPYTSDFPDYHPHMTLAYLKNGTAEKYINDLKNAEFEAHPSKIVYSRADGTKIERKING